MKRFRTPNETPLCEGFYLASLVGLGSPTPHYSRPKVPRSARTTETVWSTQTARSGDRRRTQASLGALSVIC